MQDETFEDIEKIYNIALEKEQLAIALKAKEMLLKLSNEKNPTDFYSATSKNISDHDIDTLISIIKNELENNT